MALLVKSQVNSTFGKVVTALENSQAQTYI